MYKIKKGINLPLNGKSEKNLFEKKIGSTVALIGDDYVGMRPSMEVREGDRVLRGQVLFRCKKTEGVIYTAPVSGKVLTINRGERRAFQSIVLQRDSVGEQVELNHYKGRSPETLNSQDIRNLLVESGLWTALRTRPYSKVPSPESRAHSLFVNTMDTNPLAVTSAPIIAKREQYFKSGLTVLSRMMEDKKIYLCHTPKNIPPLPHGHNIEKVSFSGKHPAGLVGTHIHFVDPVGLTKTVWYIDYQDVFNIGRLFSKGELLLEKFVSLNGPGANYAKILQTEGGTSLSDLIEGETVKNMPIRVISGSVFNGHQGNKGPFSYLGRYHNQITLLEEDNRRELLGWQMPGLKKFSVTRAFLQRFIPGSRPVITSAVHGSKRAMVPIGSYEKVMPLDILPTQLLRTLVTKDIEQAIRLGCLELDEEDLALCSFVSPGKQDFGPMLREVLTSIEKEGA